MLSRIITYEFRDPDNLYPSSSSSMTDAFSVILASSDDSYGIRRVDTGEVVVPNNTAVSHPQTGVYQYLGDFLPHIQYEASWKVVDDVGEDPFYVIENIGPFSDNSGIRAVAEHKGTFSQNTRATLFLAVTDFSGMPRDPETIYCTISTEAGVVIQQTIPEKGYDGLYIVDWTIGDATPGKYLVTWDYVVNGDNRSELQYIVVAAGGDVPDYASAYSARIIEFRMSLELMLSQAQHVVVKREPAQKSKNHQDYYFNFPRWNQVCGTRIWRNDLLIEDGYTVDYFNGKVRFDRPLTKYDRVEASYNFRWFSDSQFDRFLSNAIHILNVYPAVTRFSLFDLDQRYISAILYGATVDALRNMMLSLQFQEPQLVFGGAERADKVYSNMEGLKKNYEDTWNKILEQKKNAPYVGLTKSIVTPEFALPGGRSRWFRYLFTGGA